MSAADGSGQLRVGVIGTGAMGSSHVRTLAQWVPGARVSAVSDIDETRAAQVAAAAGARLEPDAAALIGSGDVDAVVIASPDWSHEDLVLTCLAAGKPVLCEKPLASDMAGSQRIVDAEARLGRRLVQVGFMRRYDSAYVQLRDSVRAGSAGRPRVVHCVHRNAYAHPAATTEGVIVGSMVHELDIVPWLLDDPIADITVRAPRAAGSAFRDPQVAVVETVGGVLVTVEVFVNARYGYDIACEVVGDEATLRLTPPYGLAQRRGAVDGTLVAADFVGRFADAYRVELADWVGAAAAGTASEAGAGSVDGHRAGVAAAAGVESLRTGVRVELAAVEAAFAAS